LISLSIKHASKTVILNRYGVRPNQQLQAQVGSQPVAQAQPALNCIRSRPEVDDMARKLVDTGANVLSPPGLKENR
jgi:hypothetical protein